MDGERAHTLGAASVAKQPRQGLRREEWLGLVGFLLGGVSLAVSVWQENWAAENLWFWYVTPLSALLGLAAAAYRRFPTAAVMLGLLVAGLVVASGTAVLSVNSPAEPPPPAPPQPDATLTAVTALITALAGLLASAAACLTAWVSYRQSTRSTTPPADPPDPAGDA